MAAGGVCVFNSVLTTFIIRFADSDLKQQVHLCASVSTAIKVKGLSSPDSFTAGVLKYLTPQPRFGYYIELLIYSFTCACLFVYILLW